MKIKVFFLFILSLGYSFLYSQSIEAPYPKNLVVPSDVESGKATERDLKMSQRWLIENSTFMNPETKELDLKIKNQTLNELNKKYFGGRRGPINGLTWESRGPTNRSGYTSRVAYDPNDPTGQKVWAGSETGGLWFNNNVTDTLSQWQLVDDFGFP
ncbi:MAG: hypothetical protein IPN89_02370 [Saprospiraceae bacterium]|nr:hypothetical protein [Saprospiraceae bacterium]